MTDLFSSIAQFDDLEEVDDDLCLDDPDQPADPPKKSKRPASTAEKKATHNAVERARRESLNARFLVLADMLPGMTHVKRASKAAIVNKSIDLIKQLRLSEAKLAKERDALAAEIDALRRTAHQQPRQAPAAPLFPSQLQVPMPAHPLAMAQAQDINPQLFPSLFAGFMTPNQTLAPPKNQLGPFFDPAYLAASVDSPNSESGSPNESSGLTTPAHNTQFSQGLFDLAQPPSSGLPSPPGTANYNSPSGTVASIAGSERTSQSQLSASLASTGSFQNSNAAPSPASSHSVQTPPNAYSPSLIMNGNNNNSTTGNNRQLQQPFTNDAAVSAFDSSHDVAFLAAQFAPNDLAKAQNELQAFIAYQQQAAQKGSSSSPTGIMPPAFMMPQHHQPSSQNLINGHSFNGSNSNTNNNNNGINPSSAAAAAAAAAYGLPAWHFMMAQHQAAVAAAYGAGQPAHF